MGQTIVWRQQQHELSTQTSNWGTSLRAKNRNLGSLGVLPQRASEVGPSPLVHGNTLFTKHAAVVAKVPAAIFLPNKKLKHRWWWRSTAPRVAPLTVCARCSCSGRVAGFGRCLVSTALRPDGTDWGWEDMAGTTASSKGRKRAGLPSRRYTLSSASVSQEPVVEKDENR